MAGPSFPKSQSLVKREIMFRASELGLCRFPATPGGFPQPDRSCHCLLSRLFPMAYGSPWRSSPLPRALRRHYTSSCAATAMRHPNAFPVIAAWRGWSAVQSERSRGLPTNSMHSASLRRRTMGATAITDLPRAAGAGVNRGALGNPRTVQRSEQKTRTTTLFLSIEHRNQKNRAFLSASRSLTNAGPNA